MALLELIWHKRPEIIWHKKPGGTRSEIIMHET